MSAVGTQALTVFESYSLDYSDSLCSNLMPVKTLSFGGGRDKLGISCRKSRVSTLNAPKTTSAKHGNGVLSSGKPGIEMSVNGNSPNNIVWHKCSVEKRDREALINQKGCVIWITGLSGSGKSTLACALSRSLHARGKLAYILDGDNCRHGLNRDLSFKPEDRAENIRRIGEVAKLFSDAGVICIASLISPFRKERDAIRVLFAEGDFIEVYMNVPLELCESRDPKGLYKLARAGKIKGFTGIDDPYEPPLNPEIVLNQSKEACDPPNAAAEEVIGYLERKGYLQA